MVKVLKDYGTFQEIQRDNVSRKGVYYYAKYTDSTGNIRTLERKKDNITQSQFEDNLHKVKFLKTAKEKRALSKSYITQGELKVRAKKEKIPAEEKIKTEKDYNLERELSKNKLIFDRESKKLPNEYEGQEARIILAVGRNGSLKDMSEEHFKAKLYSYMNVNGEPKGNKALFLNDVINKWGVEFKQ
jgi:hypothetical protein